MGGACCVADSSRARCSLLSPIVLCPHLGVIRPENAVIHLVFTGGTISMQRDERAGGNVPTHGGEALVGFAPELEDGLPVHD